MLDELREGLVRVVPDLGVLLTLHSARVPAGAPHSADEGDSQRVSLNDLLAAPSGWKPSCCA